MGQFDKEAQTWGLTKERHNLYKCVAMCVISLVAGALDFVVKGFLGSTATFTALDTACYMAVPVAFITGILGSVATKPVPSTWASRFMPHRTDLAVFGEVWRVNPSVFYWIMLSGRLAFVYNTFVTFLILRLSPATAAFAGNFNKSATILLSLLFFEGRHKSGLRDVMVVVAILGNIAAFTLYNVLKKRRLMRTCLQSAT